MKFRTQVKLTFVVCFFLLVNTAISGEKITVAFGEVLAPWVIVDTNQGIIVDLFEAAMAPLGYEVDHYYLPYARRTKAYQVGDVDVVSDMNLNSIEQYDLQGYFSDIAYSYENFAFSLHKNNYHFTQLNDLKNHSLLSWQDAIVHLGKEYAMMASNNPRYSETFDQSMQVKMLFLERYEVIQMDAHIFDYYRAQLAKSTEIYTKVKVDRFALLGASPNGFLFKSEKLRNEFNQQLAWLKSTGEYQKIMQRYK
ncbi:transporter substrate-binding domain-containing protein [uncultured Paraglaciecola sp.]|uniref:substrate-binding periplasmic protein n=1 Tax=uncultured Paraglaciecola sp. TaxID=1765024 RepID=UPI0030DB9569|tara:strand:- start:3063 stop:3818 length:756 start_codon:yes stop_codon:yes gene_type:complete